jgi:glutathione S-transferase
MKIYGHPGSTCTRKAMMTAHETNTPFELVLVDLGKGEHKQPEHLARQPFGQIPTIDDDGFKMYESRAISRYIDGKAGGILTPKNPQARAIMEQWMSVETSNFAPHAMKFIYQFVFKREQTSEVLKAAGAALDTAYGVLERALADQSFLAGGIFSLAEIGFMPYLEYLTHTPAAAKLTEHPRVAAWWAAARQRPTWLQAISHS